MRFLEFYRLWRMVSNLLDNADRKYYHIQLQDNTHNFKKIFRICDGILGRKWDLPLPQGNTDEELSERFNKFFITKIMYIWETLKAIHSQTIVAEDNNPPSCTQFKELLVEDIIKLIKQSPSKSCELDPIPTAILKEMILSIKPLFASIVNESHADRHLSTRSEESPCQTCAEEGQLRSHW